MRSRPLFPTADCRVPDADPRLPPLYPAPMPPGDSTPTPTPTVPDRLPCVGCGYDLIGLPEDGACPECGVAIGRSISGDHLFASSKEHRQKLASGAGEALVGVWAGWVTLVVTAGYLVVPTGRGGGVLIFELGLMGLAIAVALCASGHGWLRLTMADPQRIGDVTSRWVHRFVLRMYAWVLGYASPFLLIVWFVLDASDAATGRGGGWPILLVLSGMLLLPALALSGAIAGEVSRLARRLLEGDLADRARGLAATGWVGLGLVVVAAQFGWLAPGGMWWLLEPIAWGLAGIAVLSWAVQYHTLVRSLRIALAAVAARP